MVCRPDPIGTPKNNLKIGYSFFKTPPSLDKTKPILSKTVLIPYFMKLFDSFSHFATTSDKKSEPL